MKSYYEPIEVETKDSRLARIRWRHSTYCVLDILDGWVIQNRWWGHEERRVYMLVETDQATMEIYRVDDSWKIARVAD